jgi:hypothetical protein
MLEDHKNSTPRSSAARACRTELERQTALPQIVGDLLSSNSQGGKIILRHISAVKALKSGKSGLSSLQNSAIISVSVSPSADHKMIASAKVR